MRLVHWLILLLFPIALGACAPESACEREQQQPIRILFIGNSYTFANDLPGTFTKLACSGGHKIVTGQAAVGGAMLSDHAASTQTTDLLLKQKWDWVVLQEQSELPAVPALRAQNMYPAVRWFVTQIRQQDAQPLLFYTWAHRDGSPNTGTNTYNDMQAQLYMGYYGIARELGAPVAAVGTAWSKARNRPQPLDLWQEDGSHPNTSGTYLAACVFYATLFQESPVGLEYLAGLSQESAKDLQTIAAESVEK
jgi:hypothetical protein